MQEEDAEGRRNIGMLPTQEEEDRRRGIQNNHK